MADTLRETISLRQVAPDRFEAPPYYARARAGNAQPIAYGGIVLSQAVTAAFKTIPSGDAEYHLFSVQGSYLGPSSTEVPTNFVVQELRTTRSMATRVVTASQSVPRKTGSEERKTLVAILDFHRPEPPFLSYCAPPLHPGTYGNPDTLLPTAEAVKSTIPDAKMRAVFLQQFELIRRMFESRPVPTSAGAQNALGFVKTETSQDGLDITKRTSTSWTRANEGLESYAERCAGMAFITDAALSFLPLSLSSIPLTLARAASSMDFSLRFFAPPPEDFGRTWMLHEQNTEHAADGRSFGIARMFVRDAEAPEGLREIARMSQESILRGPEGMSMAKAQGKGAVGVKGSARAKL